MTNDIRWVGVLMLVSACQTSGGAPPKDNVTQVTSSAVGLTTSEHGPAERTYAVFGVKANDVLNVRASADYKSAKVYSYAPTVKHVKGTGNVSLVGTTPWVEVAFDGGTGWVNREYLTEVTKGNACDDSAFTAAIRAFMRSVATKDGAALAELVSPVRGLVLRYDAASPDVKFSRDQVGGLYTSSASKEWSEGAAGNVSGAFRKVWLPELEDEVAGKGAKEKCGSAGSNMGWPEDMDGLTIVSFHHPGAASEWHTTAAGFEYVDGKPYLATLVGYRPVQ